MIQLISTAALSFIIFNGAGANAASVAIDCRKSLDHLVSGYLGAQELCSQAQMCKGQSELILIMAEENKLNGIELTNAIIDSQIALSNASLLELEVLARSISEQSSLCPKY